MSVVENVFVVLLEAAPITFVVRINTCEFLTLPAMFRSDVVVLRGFHMMV